MSAYHYTILLRREEGGYTVTVPAIPAIATEGDTVEEAIAMAKDAIKLYLDFLQERGEPIPVEEGPPQVVVVDVAA